MPNFLIVTSRIHVSINRLMGGEMEVKPGIIVAGMIQDTPSGRSPLYHLQNFFAEQDTELLLDEAVDPSVFGDHNIGRVLDRIQTAGPSKIAASLPLGGWNVGCKILTGQPCRVLPKKIKRQPAFEAK